MFVKHKKIFIIILFIITILPLFLTPIKVFADNPKNHTCEICGKTHDISSDALSGLQKRVYEMNNVVYAGKLIDTEPGKNGDTNIIDALAFDISKGSFSDLWNAARGYYDAIKVVGVMLATIYSLIETLAHIKHNETTAEYFMKEIMKWSIAVIVVIEGFNIATALINLSSGIFYAVGNATTGTVANKANCIYGSFNTDPDNIFDEISGVFLCIGQIAGLLTPWLMLQACKVIISIVCWARVLEIVVRVIFAPIGIADLFVYGTNSNGVSYLRKIMATAIQGAIILGMVVAYSIIIINMKVSTGEWLAPVILAITLLTSLGSAKSIASDICGV